ncbi:MAG TPA: hypothetical protein VGL11_21080 [Candidatus Binatia bacterium]|jgi:hypothetical protein
MQITIRLDSEQIHRLTGQAFEGSLAKATLSKVIQPDSGSEGATYTIICDLPAAQALERLASVCCTPALTIIQEAINDSLPRDEATGASRTRGRRR